jgi:hypothetical protein
MLQDIDDKFLGLNLKFNYKHQQRKLTKVLLGSVALTVVLTISAIFVLKTYDIHMHPLFGGMQFWSFIASVIITHQLLVGMIGIRHRFELMNLFMKNYSHQLDCYILNNLAEIHFMICKVIKIYNEVNAAVLLSCISISFGWFCLFAFAVATGNFEFFTEYIFLALFDCLMNVMIFGIFFSIIYFAEKVKSQGMLSTKYLYEMLHKIEDFRYREVINSFIGQVQNSRMEISCGLFDINWSLLFKVRFKIIYIFLKNFIH